MLNVLRFKRSRGSIGNYNRFSCFANVEITAWRLISVLSFTLFLGDYPTAIFHKAICTAAELRARNEH